MISLFEQALREIEGQQLITGEMLSFQVGDARPQRYPLWSAIAHDALGRIDPASASFDYRTLDLLPREESRAMAARVAAIRWRLRSYLAWEEEADGTWKKWGRLSASARDAATTAGSAMALLPAHPRRIDPGGRRRKAAVLAWDDCDAVGNAYRIRFLRQAGEDVRGLTEPCYTDDPLFEFVAAPAKITVRLPPMDQNAGALAFGMSAMLDMDEHGAPIEKMLAAMLGAMAAPPVWNAYVRGDSASPGAMGAVMLANAMRGCARTGRFLQ